MVGLGSQSVIIRTAQLGTRSWVEASLQKVAAGRTLMWVRGHHGATRNEAADGVGGLVRGE